MGYTTSTVELVPVTLHDCPTPPPPPGKMATDGETGRGQDKQKHYLVLYIIYRKNVTSAQMLDVSQFGVGTVLRLERDAWSMVK